MALDPLSAMHPHVAAWFRERYREPTPVQAGVWPLAAADRHVLAIAPTGSGKTLAAFLDGISRLARGDYPADRLSILYISPLKALVEDIRVNLLEPLHGVRRRFEAEGLAWPDVRVSVRTGDTSQADRRRDLSKPPSILATTPESLAILLNSATGRGILAGTRLLILDEVHATLGSKRGAFLACAMGRLALLAGEFRRVALSATVHPLDEALGFVGAARLVRDSSGVRHEPRAVELVAPAASKVIELGVDWPEPEPLPGAASGAPTEPMARSGDGTRLEAIADAVIQRTRRNRSTLVFVDARRRAELLARLINERGGEGLAWAHHGSLSKDARRAVEARLKEGRLRCVVATASLELGIDVGSVDEVVLAGTPPSPAQALQRIGRAGHAVGVASRATLLPLHGKDLLRAAALASLVARRQIEDVRALRDPLDILAQVLLSMTLSEERKLDELFDEVRSFSPFLALRREDFDAVLAMLAGKYAEARVGELRPRLLVDPSTRSAKARDGTATLLYASGGAIADRGYYSLRLAGSRAKLGDLDEEFVWERRAGDSIAFGTQTWRIVEIGSEAVEVVPLNREADFAPFWRAESRYRAPVLADATLAFLDEWGGAAGGEAFLAELERRGFSLRAARALSSLLRAQAAALPLPGARRLSVEVCDDPSGRAETTSVILLGLRGGALMEALSLALAPELEERLGLRLDLVSGDDAILINLPRTGLDEDPAEAVLGALRALDAPGVFDRRLTARLESSGLFGAVFREDAERALLLPKAGFGKRRPLWVTRLRAKRLFEAVAPFRDFPVLAQAWRDCLQGILDVEGARSFVAALASGEVELRVSRTSAPSPFSRDAVWKETNRLLYGDDSVDPGARGGPSLSDRAVADALASPALRPGIAPEALAEFRARARRETPERRPSEPLELADWVAERLAIPLDEWNALRAACEPDMVAAFDAEPRFSGRLRRLRLGSVELVAAGERVGPLRAALAADPAGPIAEWLRSTGPEPLARVAAVFGLTPQALAAARAALLASGTCIVVDLPAAAFSDAATAEAAGNKADSGAAGLAGEVSCLSLREHYEILLRLRRRAARPAFEARPAAWLQAFTAEIQGVLPLAPPGRAVDHDATLVRALECLEGLSLPAADWETLVLNARVPEYRPSLLDERFRSGELLWYGTERGSVALVRPDALELCLAAEGASAFLGDEALRLDELRGRSGMAPSALRRALWDEAWKGLVSADSFEVLRRGLEDDFGAESLDAEELPASPGAPPGGSPFGRPRRLPAALRRGPNARGDGGRWFSLALERWAASGEGAGQGAASGASAGGGAGAAWRGDSDPQGAEGSGLGQGDILDEMSLDAERVRLVARRRGLLCRETLSRESALLGWSRLARAIRRLELSGELVAGRFFEGVSGPQFMTGEHFARLQAFEPGQALYALAARDPASLAGLGFAGLPDDLPPRAAGQRFVLRGAQLLLVARRGGRELQVFADPQDPDLPAALGALAEPRRRSVRPERRVVVELVNGAPAAASPFAPALQDLGFERDRGRLTLW